jgi:phosphatidylglycerol:prolipoprotein diacylglycerol transferase
MTADQFGIYLGPLYIRFYALLLITGIYLGGYLASVEAKRRGENPDLVWDGLFWAMIAGIVGARLWHILTPPPSMVAQGFDTLYYLNLTNTVPITLFQGVTFSVPAAFATPNGGLGIPGAVAGGLLGVYFFTRRQKLSFAVWADLCAPALALGQAVGRWGNYVNQELYGAPTSLPWGLTIDAPYRVAGFADPALKFHPLFLYESIGSLFICLALLYLARRYSDRLKNGDLFLVYLLMYPCLRFLLEFIRLDASQVLGLNANQTLMLILVVCSGFAVSARHRRVRRHELKAHSAE